MSRALVVKAQYLAGSCGRCDFAGANVPIVSPPSPLFTVIGSSPWPRDLRNAEPFTNPVGKSIRKLLAKQGLDPAAGAYMNVVSCVGAGAGQVGACSPTRLAQLAAGSDWVLAIGDLALHVFRTGVSMDVCWGVPLVRGERVIMPCPEPVDSGYDWKVDKTVRRFVELVTGGRELVGHWLFGEWCLQCRRPAEQWDGDMWPWCGKHGPKEMTVKQKEKKMREARTRANSRRQGVLDVL